MSAPSSSRRTSPLAPAVPESSSSKRSCLPSGRCARRALAPLSAALAPLAATASAAFSAMSSRMSRARGDSSTVAVSAVDVAEALAGD
eukprot:5322356-Pleurochrysis_carterae.AAC.1